MIWAALRRAFEPAEETARRFLERFATSGQARIGHEIFVGVERLFARGRLYARGTAVRQELPALLIVLEIRHHDLTLHLLVHGGVEDGTEHLDTAVEIARHHVGGGNVHRCFRMWQLMAVAEAVHATMLEEAADNRFDANII